MIGDIRGQLECSTLSDCHQMSPLSTLCEYVTSTVVENGAPDGVLSPVVFTGLNVGLLHLYYISHLVLDMYRNFVNFSTADIPEKRSKILLSVEFFS